MLRTDVDYGKHGQCWNMQTSSQFIFMNYENTQSFVSLVRIIEKKLRNQTACNFVFVRNLCEQSSSEWPNLRNFESYKLCLNDLQQSDNTWN